MNAITFFIYFIPYRIQYLSVIQLEKLLDGIYVDKQDLSDLTFYLLHRSCLSFRITIEEIITDFQFFIFTLTANIFLVGVTSQKYIKQNANNSNIV